MMPLCRWSANCDVYVYATEYGYTIHDAFEHSWYNLVSSEAIDILLNLREQKQTVPDHAFTVIQCRIDRERKHLEMSA